MSSPNMSCPDGGEFYACVDGSRFVGCCALDPCGITGCAAGNLRNTSFDTSQYGVFPDQQCDSGAFYTCNFTTPPFWGCCSTSPCGYGCSEEDLSGAFISSNPATAEPYLQLNETYSNDTGDSGDSTNVGAIAGGVIGGIAGLALIVLGSLWYIRRKRRVQDTAKVELDGSGQIAELPLSGTSKGGNGGTESYPGPPQPPYSPQPPSYWSEADSRHISAELPGSETQIEMDGNQVLTEMEGNNTPIEYKPPRSTAGV